MNTLKEKSPFIILALLLILMLKTCSVSMDVNLISKKQDKINKAIDSINYRIIDSQTMDDKLETKMWQALELEEMGDKGKSINELKNQHKKSNEKVVK